MNLRTALGAAAAAVLGLSGAAHAADLVVPDQYATIQDAVNAAVDGDTVLVKPGTYAEAVTISFKTITLASTDGAAATIIDGQNAFRPLYITGPNYRPMVKGFTIQNGFATAGGGVLVDYQADPSFYEVIVRNNHAYYGGGMYLGYGTCWVDIVDSLILDNVADYFGGGTYANVSCTAYHNTVVSGNVAWYGGGAASQGFCSTHIAYDSFITGNTAAEDGGGMWAAGSSSCGAGVRGRNAVIARNTARRGGGLAAGSFAGIELTGSTVADNVNGGVFSEGTSIWNDITNSIIWGNGAAPVFIAGSRVTGVDMEGGVQLGFVGDGTNLSVDPMFVDAAAGNYELQPGSPCINAGVVPYYQVFQVTDIAGTPRNDGSYDIGAYEYSLLKIDAAVTVDPGAFDRCKTNGTATVTVTLPPGFDPMQVLVPSVFVNDAFSTTRGEVVDGVLVLKFSKDAFVEVLEKVPAGNVELTVSGEIPGIAKFTGKSVVRVKNTVCK
jgi:hypothetical protein